MGLLVRRSSWGGCCSVKSGGGRATGGWELLGGGSRWNGRKGWKLDDGMDVGLDVAAVSGRSGCGLLGLVKMWGLDWVVEDGHPSRIGLCGGMLKCVAAACCGR